LPPDLPLDTFVPPPGGLLLLMDILSIQEMVACEQEALRSGVTALALMEAAGEAMTGRILANYPRRQKFLVLVGKGNNGGDGLVVAHHLSWAGKNVQVVLTAPENQLGELPRNRLNHLRRSFPELEITPWRAGFVFPGHSSVVIDALLGIQARGELRGTLPQIVAQLNAARERNFFRTVALDVSTGLAAYEEMQAPHDRDAAVIADLTVAVGFAKDVLCREALSGWVGRLEVVPWSSERAATGPLQSVLGPELANLLPRRSAHSHKNDFGQIAIIAGSSGFTGAAGLCTQAAQAMGAGLLSVVTHPEAVPTVAAQAPLEAMVSGWGEGKETPDPVKKASAIVIGPGLGVSDRTLHMLRRVLKVGCPVLIDADGLNVLAKNMHVLREARGPILLTPHPGEMGRLIGRTFEPDERRSVVRKFTDQHDVTLVLKGTRTLSTARGRPLYFNTTGNPGLSTGGSGDTLSGIIVALLGQDLSPLDAARFGVWLHGHAADLVLAGRGCEEGLTPTMLSGHLGAALASLRGMGISAGGLMERVR
jgi:hydroxyethylthiazole kinase-like uncharacterized protein yjeF